MYMYIHVHAIRRLRLTHCFKMYAVVMNLDRLRGFDKEYLALQIPKPESIKSIVVEYTCTCM